MPVIDIVKESDIVLTERVRQLDALFDCPVKEKISLNWKVDLPIDEEDWQIGLIYGASGSGKTTVARHLWPKEIARVNEWHTNSVIDSFDSKFSLNEISDICQAVGFNTVPSWMRPYEVLSNGEKFRVEIARQLLENDFVVLDEFTSVVDRQVAKIASYAVQKYIRKTSKKFVAVSCHDDIIDWIQPDWMLNMGTQEFQRRSLRRRPDINITIAPVSYSAWKIFAPFHYLTADLNKSAKLFGLYVEDSLASICCVLHFPHTKTNTIKSCSRLVTLPDFQGLGLAFHLVDYVGSAYYAMGYKFVTHPAHPALSRNFMKSEKWSLDRKPSFVPTGKTATLHLNTSRQCYTFSYIGEKLSYATAKEFLQCDPPKKRMRGKRK